MTATHNTGSIPIDPPVRGSGWVEHVVSVPPGPLRIAIEPIAWKEAVATIGAWSPAAAYRPVLEQRLWRAGGRGPLRHTIAVTLHDPFEQLDDRTARAEIAELLRPISDRRPLSVLPPALLRSYRSPLVHHVAELSEADPYLPEGGDAFVGLFSRLVAGLCAMPGQVGLSMLVAPAHDLRPDSALAPPPAYFDVLTEQQPGQDRQDRRVEFRLRIFAEHPILATLLARAEALCLSRRPLLSSWQVPLNATQLGAARAAITTASVDSWTGPALSAPVNPRIAALTLALAENPARSGGVVDGRPITGPLPTTGAVLGKVARPDGRRASWRLDWTQRRVHVLLAGSSGCGKTTNVKRLALDDLEAGRSVVLVDPHGDVATELATVVPPDRLVHIDPRLAEPAALDLLDPDPARAAAHLMSAVREVWPSSYSGPTWNRAISLTLRGLEASSEYPGPPTLADVERFVTQPEWRSELIKSIPDRSLRADLAHEHSVWTHEKPDGHGPSWVQYVSSKFTPLTQGPGAVLFSTPPQEPLERQLARGAVVVVALPLGLLGTETTRLTTRMFLSRLTAAIAAQGMLAEDRRPPTAVYCDEAHMMTGGALAGLFAQARKFGAAIHVAVQAPSMLGEHLDEILTNTQTHLLGRLGAAQAAHLVDRAGPQTVRTLPTLPKHHLVVVTEDHDPAGAPVVLTPVPPP